MLGDLTNSDAMPALEMSLRFAGQRQRLIAHNIANLSTPGFVAQDVSVADFRKVLGEAVEARRERNSGGLEWRETRELRRGFDGSLRIQPRTPGAGVLFYDHGTRDVERLMQDQAENSMAFRVASDLLKGRFDLLKMAIRGRE